MNIKMTTMEIKIKTSNLNYRAGQTFDVSFCTKDELKACLLLEGMSRSAGDYYVRRDWLPFNSNFPPLIYRKDATITDVEILGKSKPYPGPEKELQKKCIDYLKRTLNCDLTLHVPNSSYAKGKRGFTMKKSGFDEGFPDILLFEQHDSYCGLCVELKVAGGEYRTEQFDFLQLFADKGWRSVVCWNFDVFIQLANEYTRKGIMA